MKVAIVNPPIVGHEYRGTGVYTDNLYRNLTKISDVSVNLVNYGSDFSDFDVMHFPYFDPFFLTMPLFKKKPAVVTIHDLIPIKFPNFFKRGIRGEFKWAIQKISLKGSQAIITDSIASKDDIMRYIGIKPDNIHVIYLGVDENFKVINDKTKLDDVRKKYSLPKDFILNVGDVNYNKNIPGLITAFHKVLQKNNYLYLVLVGNGFVNPSIQLSKLQELVEKLNLDGRVIRIGYIPKEDLLGIYNQATMYMQISYAEGFGLPVLEAMACGCPVIASNLSSLPELVGEAGILVDPRDYESIVRAINELFIDVSKHRYIKEKALKRIRIFTWESCAKQTIEVYKQVLFPKHI